LPGINSQIHVVVFAGEQVSGSGIGMLNLFRVYSSFYDSKYKDDMFFGFCLKSKIAIIVTISFSIS